MKNAYTIFCPECEALILDAATCPACGWQRPAATADLGAALAQPVPLGRVVAGRPAAMGDIIWYAAPPDKREMPGALLAVQRDGSAVRRKELAANGGLPVVTSLCHDGHHLLVAALDYALSDERSPKAVMALEPVAGKQVWQVETPSRELNGPTRQGDRLYCSGSSPTLLYAISLAERRLLWQVPLAVDFRFRPVATEQVVLAVTGSLMGPWQLTTVTAATGQTIWQQVYGRPPGQPTATPEAIYVPAEKGIYAYDLASGQVQWHYTDLRSTSAGVTTAPLTVAGDLLLAATGSLQSDGQLGYALHALDRHSGRRQWRFDVPVTPPGHVLVAPYVIDDLVIIGDRQGGVYALDRTDGHLRWQISLSGRLAALPVAVGDGLLLPTRDGLLHRRRWRPAASRPPQPAAAYEAVQDWTTAAVAHALSQPPDLQAAAHCLLRADQPQPALRLFTEVGDAAGRALALAKLEQYEEAISLASQLDGEQIAPQVRADWLTAAGRHAEAGDIYWQLAAYAEAGSAYEQGKRPLRAIEAYKKAGLADKVEELSQKLDLTKVDRAIVSKLIGWERLARRYEENGHLAAAADLYEQHEAWTKATRLHERVSNWARVRDLSRQRGDWQREAYALSQWAAQAETEQQRVSRCVQAGDLYAGQRAWADALTQYEAADHRLKWAQALAELDRMVEAAELLAQADELHPLAAARYYEQAAQARRANLLETHRHRRDPETAVLYEQAAEYYRHVGHDEASQLCQIQADACLKRPRLLLVPGGQLDRPFQAGAISIFTVQIENTGQGAADQIKVLACGPALRRVEPDMVVGELPGLLPAGQVCEANIHLLPKDYSQEGERLQFDLYIQYIDPTDPQPEPYRDGPFAIYQQVLHAYQELATAAAGPVTINHIFNQGYWAEGDQVNMPRAAAAAGLPGAVRSLHAGGDQINIGLQRKVMDSSAGEPKKKQDVTACPVCHGKPEAADKYCTQCGHPLVPGQAESAAETAAQHHRLRQRLVATFNIDELRLLARDLAVDPETIVGDTLEVIAAELIAYLQRRHRLAELVAACQHLRPNTEWPSVPPGE